MTRTMTLRRSGLAAATLAALTIGAGSAAPSPAASGPTLIAGPVTVKAYKLTITASRDGGKTSLTLQLLRTSGKATQLHMYSFSLPAAAFTWKKDLSGATVKTLAGLGPFGKITAAFGHAGRLSVAAAQAPCKGSVQGRSGTLAGPFSFAADSGTYFGTISLRSMPARLTRGGASLTCTGPSKPTPNAPGLNLFGTVGDPSSPGGSFIASKAASGQVTETMLVNEQQAPASIFHSIVVRAGAGAFSAAADLSTANVDGSAGAPFFGGSLSFTAVAPAQTAGGCQIAAGQLGGGLTAHFDSVGDKTIGDGAFGNVSKCG